MAAEHVHDVGFIVVAWSRRVVVRSTRNLNALGNVPESTGEIQFYIMIYGYPNLVCPTFKQKQAKCEILSRAVISQQVISKANVELKNKDSTKIEQFLL